MSEEIIEYNKVYNSVMKKMHTLEDLLNRKVKVIVEGDSGLDVIRSRQMGLFTCNVKGIDIMAMCESDAAPLIHYIEQGGTYGSLDFSRLLGYTDEEIAEYKKLLELQAKTKIPNFSSGLQGSTSETTNASGAVAIIPVAIAFASVAIFFHMLKKES